jgi:UDP-glucose 4-epimerase
MQLKERTVVVTGSKGFVGSRLVEALSSAGYSLIGMDISDNVDITREDDIKNALNGISPGDIEAVFHLAAKMFVPHAWDAPDETFKINLMGTRNLLEQCRTMDIKKFIFASSYVYGPAEYLPIDENHPVNPSNPYAESKVMAEEACKTFHDEHGISCIILRPFNLYGPGQSPNFLIPKIIKQLQEGKIELMDPEPRRDYLYISDMIDAYLKAADYSGSGYDIFNIGYGKSYSVAEVVEIIFKLSGKSVPVSYKGERRKGEVMDTVADITKAKDQLNWIPTVSIEDGLKKLL